MYDIIHTIVYDDSHVHFYYNISQNRILSQTLTISSQNIIYALKSSIIIEPLFTSKINWFNENHL